MPPPRLSLTHKLFGAIGVTALAVVLVMALLIASSMRDGFAKYLLREELVLLEPVAEALAERYDPATPGWPEFRANPYAWRSFVREFRPAPPDFPAPGVAEQSGPPGGQPQDRPDEPPGEPPDGHPGEHPVGLPGDQSTPIPPRATGVAPPELAEPSVPPVPGAPPPEVSGAQPPQPVHGAAPPGRPDPFMDRLLLMDSTGQVVVGERIEGLALETVAITAPGADPDAAPLGWLGIAAPGAIQKETDLFFLRGQLRALATAALVALGLSGIGAFLLARGFLVPIRALERGAQRLAGGDYGARIANTRSDELGLLIDHTNALARSLEAAEQAQRAWISDTSHELQTPLAVLRANIEAIEDGVRPADTRTLGAMAEAVERLTRLVRDLRLLSTWREEASLSERRMTDLAAIVQAAAIGAEDRFAAAGLALAAEIDAPLPVRGDPQQLRQVIDNLLENTLRYTDAPGRARLRAWRDAGHVHVALDDTAPPPPPVSMPHLFDRFHRGEASRSRAHGGSGLGLAICKAIVEAHGGQIAAEVSELGGLGVSFTLAAQSQTDKPLGEDR